MSNDNCDNAPVKWRFEKLLRRTYCPYASLAKISFGPSWRSDENTRENLNRYIEHFDEFVQRIELEAIDMFVLEVRDQNHIQNINTFSAFLHTLLERLHNADPIRTGALIEGITSPEWDFKYKGVKFFILTFAPFYDKYHGRYSHCEDTGFVTFQPDQSFDRFGINRKSPNRLKVSEAVRDAFEERGIQYHFSLVTRAVKALRYIQPLEVAQDPVEWWKEPTIEDSSS